MNHRSNSRSKSSELNFQVLDVNVRFLIHDILLLMDLESKLESTDLLHGLVVKSRTHLHKEACRILKEWQDNHGR